MIGICAFSAAVQTFLLFGKGEKGLAYSTFLAFSTLFVYHFEPKRSKKSLFALLFFLLADLIFVEKGWTIWPGLIVGAGVSAFYFLPQTAFSLRGSTFLKPISVATVWAVLSIKTPLLLMGEPFCFALFAERFCFIAALAIGWDLVDFETDSRLRLPTLPVRFGFLAAQKMTFLLLLGASFCSFWLFETSVYGPEILAAILISFAFSAFVLATKTEKGYPVSTKIWLDAAIILQAAAVAAAIFWLKK